MVLKALTSPRVSLGFLLQTAFHTRARFINGLTLYMRKTSTLIMNAFPIITKTRVHASELMTSQRRASLSHTGSCQLALVTAVTTIDTVSISPLALSSADYNCTQPTDQLRPSFKLRPLLHWVSNASCPALEAQSMNMHKI